MAQERLQRRLAAILSADVVGYSRLMGLDEEGTLARLKAMRRDLVDPTIAAHCGRIVKLMGDGALVEFGSAVDAVTCAIEIQRQVREHNAGGSEVTPIQFRIGVDVGDIIIQGDDIYGDGVNIALFAPAPQWRTKCCEELCMIDTPSADVATLASFVLASSGYPEEAVAQIERAMTLSPNYPADYLGHLGNAYQFAGRIEEALTAFKAYDARSSGSGPGLADLVIAYQENSQPDEARRTAQRLLAARRDFTIASWLKTQFTRRDAKRLDTDVAALRAAGLPMG